MSMHQRAWNGGAPSNPAADPHRTAAALTQPLHHTAKVAKRKPRSTSSLPFAQISSMFRERMQSIMLQDKAAMRQLWRRFGDTDDRGVITAEQFHEALTYLGIFIDQRDSAKFMTKFSDGNPNQITFRDFFFGILGLPLDFFSMNLSQPVQKDQKGTSLDRQQGPLLPAGTPLEQILKTFRARIRRKLFDTKAVCTRVLRQSPHDSHFNRDHLFDIMHNHGIDLNAADLESIMAYYDHDRDGKLHYREFVNDLLKLPLSREMRGKTRQPHIMLPNFGSKRVKDALHCLVLNCERASAPPRSILGFLHAYDTDGSGKIAYDEFKLMVRDLNCQVENADAAAMLLNEFSPHTGVLSYMQFMMQVLGLRRAALRELDNFDKPSTPELVEQVSNKTKQKLLGSRRAAEKAFGMLDDDGGGSIRIAEFAASVKNLGLPMNSKQAAQLFRTLDPDGSGELDASELGKHLQVQDDQPEGTQFPQQQPALSRYEGSRVTDRHLRHSETMSARRSMAEISQLLASAERALSSRRAPPPNAPLSANPPRLAPIKSMHRTMPGPCGRASHRSMRSAPPMMDVETMMHAEFMKRSQSTQPLPLASLPASMVRAASSAAGFKRIGGQTLASATAARRLHSNRNHFNADLELYHSGRAESSHSRMTL